MLPKINLSDLKDCFDSLLYQNSDPDCVF